MTAAIAIGLPVYNGAVYLAQAIESLLAQDCRDFELLVADNASTDASADIAAGYAKRDARVKVVRWSRNVGAAANFNKVFENTSGEFFKWAAHDDLCAPAFLERTLGVLANERRLVLAHTATLRIDAAGNTVGRYDTEPNLESDDPCERFAALVNSPHFCITVFGLMRRATLARTPLIGAYVGSDRNLLAELALMGAVRVVDEPLFMRRDHPDCSIRRFVDERRRLAWFDPRLDGRGHRPTLRRLEEYAKSIARVPLSDRDRTRCLAVLDDWRRNGLHHTGRPIAELIAAESGSGVHAAAGGAA